MRMYRVYTMYEACTKSWKIPMQELLQPVGSLRLGRDMIEMMYDIRSRRT